MSEQKFSVVVSGQEVQKSDINLVSSVAATMDDKVIAELFRLTPFNGSTVTKAILGYTSPTSSNSATVQSSGSGNASIHVKPFRAIAGSRTAEGTSAKDNWKQSDSAVFVGSTTTLDDVIQCAANSSGNPRWDLIYASISIDDNDSTLLRYIKDPLSSTVTPTPVAIKTTTKIAVNRIQGTPAGTPTLPPVPADTPGATYNLPLAYIRIPTGFTLSSTIPSTDIKVVSPNICMSSKSNGVNVAQPATVSTALDTPGINAWASTGTRHPLYIPADTRGSTTLTFGLDVSDATPANWPGAWNLSGLFGPRLVIDSSRDWSNYMIEYIIYYTVIGGTPQFLPWTLSPTDIVNETAFGAQDYTVNSTGVGASQHAVYMGLTNSFTVQSDLNTPGAGIIAMIGGSTTCGGMPGSTSITFDVESGSIIANVVGSPLTKLFAKLTCYGPYSNR